MSKHKAKLGFTGHFKEVELALAAGEPAPWDPGYAFQVAHKPQPRLDGFAKVTGQAKYTADIQRPGMLVGRILRSPHACAEIVKIDTSKALALPGVKAIEVLPGRDVRYAGQAIAAVAATNARIADDALRLIKVLYAVKPFVVDIEKAKKPGAALVYPSRKRHETSTMSGNCKPGRSNGNQQGDVAQGLKDAQHIIEGTFHTQVQTHSCLEPHGIVAEWEGNKLTVWASTQGTFSVRDELAQAFGLAASDVKVITEYMGGGFGSKFGAGTEGLFAAKLAKQAKAPVQMMCTRKGEQLATGNRPGSTQKMKFGIKQDGALTAMQLHSYGSGGIAGGAGTSRPMLQMYNCANRSAEEYDVFTHAGPARAFRAPGHPQGAFALESMIDMCAEKVGLDPLQMRMKHDPHPVRLAQMKLGAQRIGWAKRNQVPGAAKGTRKRGIGMASGLWYNTGRPGAQVQIKIHKDATVEVINGGQDIGTGFRTILGQIVAEELGLPLSAIQVKIGNTEYPYAPGSGGSKTTPCVTPAARSAAHKALQVLFGLARKLLKLPDATAMVAKGGKIFQQGKPTTSVDFAKVVRYLPQGLLDVKADRAANMAAFNNIIAGVQFADVEVDTQTGQVKVHKIVAVHDCGIALNQLTTRSQINGGVIQGVSYALFEDRLLDPSTGRMINPNLEQYKIAGSLDMPEIDVVLFDVFNGSNNAHVMGIGEPCTVPTSAAIANAVYNAIGARVFSLPITPARVLEALATKQGKKKP